MKIINMVDDFRLFHHDIKKIGKWNAFVKYYEKYNEIFNLMLKGLYMIDFDNFRPIVEQTDFDYVLKKIESVDLNIFESIKSITKKAVDNLNFEEEFDLYIGVGLGHVGGTALPSKSPCIYFGLECLDNCDLDYLIPHEANHMVRIQAIEDISLYSFLERVITEGLGVMYPIILNNLPVNIETLSKTLVITKKQVEMLIENEEELIKEVSKHFSDTLNYNLMNNFFTGNVLDENKPILAGYYIGLIMIEKAILAGQSIDTLTKLPAETFIPYITQY